MDSNYSSKYSGEQVDAAVEYFLNHQQIEDNSSYEYTSTIFCRNSTFPAKPFDTAALPTLMPTEFPFAGTDGNLWYDVPNTSTKDWYQCILKINFQSNKVVSQSAVMDMTGKTGNDGSNGQNGQNGKDGEDGEDGKDGNYIEFRYKRSSEYAITLGTEQRSSRVPEGWVTDWEAADVNDYSTVKRSIGMSFDIFLTTFSSISNVISFSSSNYFTELGNSPLFGEISAMFYSLHGVRLVANEEQMSTIETAYKEFKELWNNCTNEAMGELDCNTEYHRLYTKYIDESHFWVLFMISAKISGADDSLIGEWSTPQRIQGTDGKPGPSGSNGIDGIPGVNIGVAFTLGTEDAIRPDAANPTSSPYNTNYGAIFASGTKWQKDTPSVSTTYPYIWFTQCRYRVVSKTVNGVTQDTYEFEDTWSVPARYTGLNGVTTHETVYTKNPIIYPQGIYTSGTTYVNDGSRTPYVYYDGNYYYLSGQGRWTGTTTSTPANNSAWWTLLEGFEALYTKVGIIANGLIGSAVFNGDFMFSQQGVDQNGTATSHYENFLKNYSTGATLVNPYDSMASFKPNYCINFKTGEQWSTSVSSAIEGAKSEVIQTAQEISMSVKETINGELKQAGIDISADGVTVTGKFKGTSDGTFSGDVSAKSLAVLGDDGTKAMVFDTYKEAMGTPSGGTAPEEGTPVLLMNFKGNQYLVSMLKLVTGSSSGQYRQTQAVIEDLYTTSSIANRMGTQGYAQYHRITGAPYLTLIDNNGNATSTQIAAKLYDPSGTSELSWTTYLNKYYSGTLITEYPDKTDLGSGIWAFKLTGSLATTSGTLYNGRPANKTMAVASFIAYSDTGVGLKTALCYCSDTSDIYSKISILNGVLSTLADGKIVVGYGVKPSGSSLVSDTSSTKFLKCSGYSQTAHYMTAAGTETTSSYFATTLNTSQEWTSVEVTQCAAIVGPRPINPLT
jgi:hypothetical protein